LILTGAGYVSDLILRPRTPLASVLKPGLFGRTLPEPEVRLMEISDLALATIIARRGCAPELAALIREQFGVELPFGPRRIEGREIAFTWSGINQWLASAPGTARQLESQLRPLAQFAAASDHSDARAIIRVAGPRARQTLAKGLAIDLHPRSFRVGDCALTLIGHIGTHLWQVDDVPTYDIAVFRSLGESFVHWLTEAAAEFGYRIDVAE
jgi:sarcosine oxidase subunit gamma